MIIWINGSFGVGKSTVANLLHQEFKNSIIYDPELLGDFFQRNLPSVACSEDFQDFSLWRQLTHDILQDLATNSNQIIIVPMTIFKIEYYQEIIEQLMRDGIELKHYILIADKETILNRLDSRVDEDNLWARHHLDTCINGFDKIIPGRKLITDQMTPREIVKVILEENRVV